jgi:molecular chaperone DnaK (HSP70)
MACGETISKSLIVAAIDFGTTFSGYAFALRHDYKVDHMRVLGNPWQRGSQPGFSLKTPSCVLFDPTQKLHSFGSDAEDKYVDLAQEDEHIDWFYFKRFKMQLYDKHVSLKFPAINYLIKKVLFANVEKTDILC